METKALAKQNIQPPADTDLNPNMLLKLALEKDFDIDRLNKLLDMQRQWKAEQARKLFFEALVGFQALVPAIKKNKKADIKSDRGSYSYKYAELGSVEAQIKKAMEICGLTKRWEIDEDGGQIKVKCLITHIEGHTEFTEMKAEKDSSGGKNNIQQKASTITYLKRYTLLGGLGISTADEDIDGQGTPTAAGAKDAPKQLTEDEILAQWQQRINEATTRVELAAFYAKNKKAIDKSSKLLDMYNARKEQLPPVKTTTLP
jgi:hypothetical protein